MKNEVYCVFLQFINSLEGLGLFFSSAALIRRLRRYDATLSNRGDASQLCNVLFSLERTLRDVSKTRIGEKWLLNWKSAFQNFDRKWKGQWSTKKLWTFLCNLKKWWKNHYESWIIVQKCQQNHTTEARIYEWEHQLSQHNFLSSKVLFSPMNMSNEWIWSSEKTLLL